MKPYPKMITRIPLLIFLSSSIVYAQTEVKENKKEIEALLHAPAIESVKDLPKLSGSDKKQIDSLQKREGSNESSESKPKPKRAQNFTGSGPAVARDNPDA